MCRKLIMLVLLLAVVAGIAPVTRAAFITNVVRRNPDGNSGDTEPQIAPNPLNENALCYVDRAHQYRSVPAYLIGAEYVMTANDDKDNGSHELDVTLSEAVTVYLFLDNRLQPSGTGAGTGQGVNPNLSGMPWVAAMGFTDTGDDIAIDEAGDGTIDRWSSVFSKKFPAGTITLKGDPQGYGGNMYGVAVKGPQLKARDPDPPDGAPDVVTPLRKWTAGETATFHDVYLGTSPTLGTADFKSRSSMAMYWHDSFVPGTTYYWRVDEVEADGVTVHTGDLWSFKAATLIAYSPSPPDGAKYVSIDADLSWTPGISGITHDVYFGTNQADVANGTGGTSKGNQPAKTYEPGTLQKDTVYYWRIDEVEFDKTTKHEGTVWSFKTAPDITIADPNLLCWWKFDEGAGTTAVDWSGHDHHGTLEGDPQWVDGFAGGALQFGGDGDRVVDNVAAAYLNGLGAVTVCMWIKSDVTGTDRGFIDGEDPDGNDNVMTMRYDAAGSGFAGTNVAKMAVTSDTGGEQQLESGSDIQTTEWQHVAMTWSGGGLIRFYINGVEDTPTGRNGPNNAGVTSGCTKLIIGQGGKDAGSGWDGLIDDVRIYNKVLTPEQIKQAMRGDPTLAWNPKPANKSLTDVERAAPLTWSPGEKAAQHDVYFGTDQTAVANATAASTGIYRGRQVAASYAPPEGIQWGGGPYYWRIDEYNTDGTLSAGRVWSFTVADYLIVDDFDDYTDDVGSRIFQTWRDGFGFSEPAPGYPGNGTGSAVGYAQAPFAEQTIVRGKQSMPLEYNNSGATGKARYSETQREWASPLDWTKYSLKALTLYFYGALANAAEQLYVALEDNAGHVKVVNYPDPEAVQAAGWQEWNIELTQFSGAGVNLKAIKRMYIGLGNRTSPKVGGTGTIFIDDIRLYPSRCVPSIDKPAADLNGDCIVDQADVDILASLWLDSGFQVTPADPGTTGLIAHYPFNGNTNDVVGAHNGTTVGTPVYTTGKIGQAIQLNGVDQMVDVGSVGISGAAPRTVSGWAKSNSTAMPDWTNIFGFTGTDDANLSGRSFDIELRGAQLQFCLHVYGWEDNILPLDLDWHHLAATYDGTTISWYGDGRLIGSLVRTPALNTEDTVHIGQRGDTGEAVNFFPGKVDDVKIWNRALTGAQIASLAGRTSTFSIPADLHQDGVINFKDFAKLADSWLEEILWP
jgi:hypothetical protein